jgi:hypothetical protein
MTLSILWADRALHPDLPVPEPRRVTIYWPEAVQTKVPRGKSGRLTAVKQTVWRSHSFVFAALRDDGDGSPPRNDDDVVRMALRAYALAASHSPIPSDATVLYEVTA